MAKKSRDPKLDHIIMYFNHQPISLADIGPAADLPLNEGLQYLVDNGWFGDELIGQKWFEVINTETITLTDRPSPDETLLYSLYSDFKDYESQCMQMGIDGVFDKAAREELMARRKKYETALKLSAP